MKVLVTGGAGFIGSHVVEALANAGHEILVIDDFSSGKLSNLADAGLVGKEQALGAAPRLDSQHAGREPAQGTSEALSLTAIPSLEPLTLFAADIRDSRVESIFEAYRPDIVFHLAAQIDVRKSVADPIHDADVNILGTLNLLESCRHHNVDRFIFTSSGGCVYGEPLQLPVDETHPRNPDAPYGIGKEVMGAYLDFYERNFAISHTTLALGNVYGPRQDPHGEAGVVAIFIGRMMERQTPIIFGDGEQQRDFVYVKDVVAAYLAAIDKGSSEFLNIGTGAGTSVNQLYKKLAELSSFEGDPDYGPPRAGELSRIFLDTTRAGQALGWKAETGLDEGLRLTYDWFRNHLPRSEHSSIASGD